MRLTQKSATIRKIVVAVVQWLVQARFFTNH